MLYIILIYSVALGPSLCLTSCATSFKSPIRLSCNRCSVHSYGSVRFDMRKSSIPSQYQIATLGLSVEFLIWLDNSGRLRWSRGSVLAFSTQVCGFKPDRSRRIFKGEKILSTPSFGGEVKPSVPCRRFAAYKRSLNGVEVVISAKLPDDILAHSSTFRR